MNGLCHLQEKSMLVINIFVRRNNLVYVKVAQTSNGTFKLPEISEIERVYFSGCTSSALSSVGYLTILSYTVSMNRISRQNFLRSVTCQTGTYVIRKASFVGNCY